MSDNMDITITGKCPGRALYVGHHGEQYVARRYAIYRSTDSGATWQQDCYIPASGWRPIAALGRLGVRLLRFYIAALQIVADGSRVAVAQDGVYYAEPADTRMTRTFRITRGSRPLNLTVDGNRVIFGEYGSGYESSEVAIYVSEDGGRTFDVGYRFPKSDIRHVHNVQVDPDGKGYWVFVGDHGRQPGIGLLSRDMRTMDWLCRGRQRARIVSAIIEPDCFVCGTDSDCERNFIVRIDKQSGRIDDLLEVEGSSLYSTRFGPVRLISTCVEPNPACSSRECALYASVNGEDWKRAAVFQKDRYHPTYFQFGTLVLPYSHSPQPRGMFSGQAVKGLDNTVAFVDFDCPSFVQRPDGRCNTI